MYMPIATEDSIYNPYHASEMELEDTPVSSPTRVVPKPPTSKKKINKLPFRRIFTRNVIITLFSRGVLAMHIGTFGNLWYIYLSTPRAKDSNASAHGIHFTGGMGLPPNRIGIVLSLIGGIGIFMQLILYPAMSQKFGTTLCYRFSLLLFPVAYFLAPFLVLLPSTTLPPRPASGFLVWGGILFVLFFHVLGRTFAMPSATILVNNCCPHPSVLSSIHGVAQSVSSGMRMLGPVFGGWGFALALQIQVIGFPFWVIMLLSALACVLSLAVREGDGHEIKMEGEEEEEAAEKLMQRIDTDVVDVERRNNAGMAEIRTP
jgi:MFS family permease